MPRSDSDSLDESALDVAEARVAHPDPHGTDTSDPGGPHPDAQDDEDGFHDHEDGFHDDEDGFHDDDRYTVFDQVIEYRWRRMALLGGVGSWAMLALVTFVVLGRIGNPVDATFYEMSPGFDSWNLAQVMRVGRMFGDVRLVLPVAVILFGVSMYHPRWRRPGSYAFATFIGGVGVGTGLKYLLHQPGPPEFGVQATTGTAFPSGHAMVATIFYGVLVGFAAMFVAAPRLPFLVAVWEVAALGVGSCQVLLRTHWLSDVVAAWFFGFGWVCLAVLVIGYLEARRGRRHGVPSSETG